MATESSKQYTLNCEPGRTTFQGQFSLPTPLAFDELYAEIRRGIEEADESYVIDVVGTSFMSSSGITALARVIMHARSHDKALVFRVDDEVLWQRKTIVALQNLWEKLTIERVGGE